MAQQSTSLAFSRMNFLPCRPEGMTKRFFRKVDISSYTSEISLTNSSPSSDPHLKGSLLIWMKGGNSPVGSSSATSSSSSSSSESEVGSSRGGALSRTSGWRPATAPNVTLPEPATLSMTSGRRPATAPIATTLSMTSGRCTATAPNATLPAPATMCLASTAPIATQPTPAPKDRLCLAKRLSFWKSKHSRSA